MEYCLRAGRLEMSDIDHVVFYEKPFVKLDRLLGTYSRVGASGWASARDALPLWARHRIDIAGDVRRLGPGCAR